MTEVLVVYFSQHGSTEALARRVCRGVEEVSGVSAKLRTVPAVSTDHEARGDEIPQDGPIYAKSEDLRQCDALVLGSPTRFGNMAAPLKHFIDQTSGVWLSGDLSGKPGAVFTSTGSMHGGQESTLLSMMLPLLHHGMLLVGLPYTNAALNDTQTGGTPYGASHVAGNGSRQSNKLSGHEQELAQALGHRVASFATRLNQ
ncbi:MAG: NAD(P)H:quinone oxidoreductase [Pseudomonadota bacterium]